MLPDHTPTMRRVDKGAATLGDCAFAALAQARGKKPSDYGLVTNAASFPMRATGGGLSKSLSFYWFPDEGARQDGWKKWKSDVEKSSSKAGR
jgi:hypothetical protein